MGLTAIGKIDLGGYALNTEEDLRAVLHGAARSPNEPLDMDFTSTPFTSRPRGITVILLAAVGVLSLLTLSVIAMKGSPVAPEITVDPMSTGEHASPTEAQTMSGQPSRAVIGDVATVAVPANWRAVTVSSEADIEAGNCAPDASSNTIYVLHVGVTQGRCDVDALTAGDNAAVVILYGESAGMKGPVDFEEVSLNGQEGYRLPSRRDGFAEYYFDLDGTFLRIFAWDGADEAATQEVMQGLSFGS